MQESRHPPQDRSRSPHRELKKGGKASSWQIRHVKNTNVSAEKTFPEHLPVQPSQTKIARAVIKSWEGYRPTDLIEADTGSKKVGRIFLKAETERFGTTSFKVLGGAYAVQRFLHENPGKKVTIVAASAGNHAIGVAKACELAKTACVIYFPKAVTALNVKRARAFGAVVHQIDGSYEEACVCAKKAIENVNNSGETWQLVQDGSGQFPDYQTIPRNIFEGYTMIGEEMVEQLHTLMGSKDAHFTHVLINAGVGGLATALCSYFWGLYGSSEKQRPRFISVEPDRCACLMEACELGTNVAPDGPDVAMPFVRTGKDFTSVQVGLDCKRGDAMAWRALRLGCDDFVSIGDECVEASMQKVLATSGIKAGESAVAGFGVLSACEEDEELRNALDLNEKSVVGVVICEGPTTEE